MWQVANFIYIVIPLINRRIYSRIPVGNVQLAESFNKSNFSAVGSSCNPSDITVHTNRDNATKALAI
jgi:hypothetical protein